MSTLYSVVLGVLGLGLLVAFVRLARGPSVADRVIAFDLMVSLGIGIMATFAIATGQPILLDVAIVLALIAFLGTVAFAYYLERRA